MRPPNRRARAVATVFEIQMFVFGLGAVPVTIHAYAFGDALSFVFAILLCYGTVASFSLARRWHRRAWGVDK